MKPAIIKRNGPTWRAVSSYLKAGNTVVGIDEVGRGAWAGPVVAAAVVLPPKFKIAGLNDSKLIAISQRVVLDRIIRRFALAVGIGWVSSAEVDENGLTWAVRESGIRSLAGWDIDDSFNIILDGKHNYLKDIYVSEVHVHADALITPVAAASIVAKVARDRYMVAMSIQSPGYGFEFHKGYGTAVHQSAIDQLGITTHHRRSYAPIAKLLTAQE